MKAEAGAKDRAGGAVEMPGLWKEWKAKSRLPTLSTSPLGISPKGGEIPTFPQLLAKRSGKVENQKQVSHFPIPLRDYDSGSLLKTTKPGYRPPTRRRRSAPPKE